MTIVRAILLLVCAAAAWGQAVWTPASVPDCAVWLRADDLGSNGSTVSSWASRCGSTTATAVNAGTVTSGPNGHKAVLFNGTNTYYTINSTTAPRTILALYVSTGAYNVWRGILAGDAAGTTFGGFAMTAHSGSGQSRFLWHLSGGDLELLSGGPSPTTFWNLAGGVLNGTTATFRYHRTAINTGSGTGTLPTLTSMVLGAEYFNHALTDYFKGSIAEVLAFNRALSDAEIASVETYLEDRYFRPQNTYAFYGMYGTGADPEYLGGQKSDDASTWSVWDQSPDYNLRDASVIYYKGKYWMVATACHSWSTTCTWGTPASLTFDLSSSLNGGVWKYQKAITGNPLTFNNTNTRTWAPEWFIDADGSLHVFLGVGNQGGEVSMQIYEVHPTTSDPMGTWSTPALVDTSGLNSGNIIDPFIRRIGATYYLLAKYASPTSLTKVLSSSSLMGPYTYVSDLNGFEGPSLMRVGQKWRAYSVMSTSYPTWAYRESTDMVTWDSAVNFTPGAISGIPKFNQGTPRRTYEYLPVGSVGQ